MNQAFGIDLGSDTVKIYDRRDDSISIDKNYIAVRTPLKIIAVGNDAYEIYERNPMDMVVESPVIDGRIANVMETEAVLQTLLFRQKHYVGSRQDIYFAVPMDTTEVERRAYASVTRRGRLKDCNIYFIEKPIADAAALGINTKKTKGAMIVNIGASVTEISVIADSRIILSRTVKFGGNTIDEEIVSRVTRKNHLSISTKTAEQLKLMYASLESTFPAEGCLVLGVDTDNGLPREGYISSATIVSIVKEAFTSFAKEITNIISRTPPQVRDIIMLTGFTVTGGSSRISGVVPFLTAECGMQARLSDLYELCTVSGLKEIINEPAGVKSAYVRKRR